jgi:hypothetical protein
MIQYNTNCQVDLIWMLKGTTIWKILFSLIALAALVAPAIQKACHRGKNPAAPFFFDLDCGGLMPA